MNLSITGARSELGGIVSQRRASGATAGVHINLAGQRANTLLHDGHAWKDFARTALAGAKRSVRDAQAGGAPMLVHASFAFVHAFELGARLEQPLRSAVDAILECEALVLSGPVPACVVRLGYLYGPASADLRAYRTAFRLGRPYWSGPPKALQYHVHQFDAASALLGAAKPPTTRGKDLLRHRRRRGFVQASDGCVRASDRSANAVASSVVVEALRQGDHREEHMQQVALPMPPEAPTPRVPGWKPKFPDYRQGIDQVVEAWELAHDADR